MRATVAVLVLACALSGCVGGGSELPSMPWVLVEADGRMLQTDYIAGDGSRIVFDHVQVEHDTRTVEATVISHGGQDVCPGVLVSWTTRLILDRRSARAAWCTPR